MTVVIVDYGSGNLRSAAKAFERVVRENGSGHQVIVSSDPEDLKKADRIVLPGVGAFGDCKRGLSNLPGMLDTLSDEVLNKGKPFFGICVGMQLLASVGREHGDHEGLGWIKGEVVPLTPDDKSLKIPHMGWNVIEIHGSLHPMLQGLESGVHAYFVHSYHFLPEDDDNVLATVGYGGPVTAAVGRDNIFGTQFHPEKSQKVGLHIIENFLNWKP